MPQPKGGLRDRVQLLVDRYWQGSVNAAAKAFGVPQPTLQRIVTGTTPNPRAEVLQRIVDHSPPGTTLDWLVAGRGSEPPTVGDLGQPISGHLLRWNAVIDSLNLEPVIATALRELPTAPMFMAFDFAVLDGSEEEPDFTSADLAYVSNAFDECTDMWAGVLEQAIRRHGRERIRETLNDQFQPILMGYTPFSRLYDYHTNRDGEVRQLYLELVANAPKVPARRARQATRKLRRH